MLTFPRLAPRRFDAPFITGVAIGSLCLIAQILSMIGLAVKNGDPHLQQAASAQMEFLARDLETEWARGPRGGSGAGQAETTAEPANGWKSFAQRLNRIGSQIPEPRKKGVNLDTVGRLLGEIRLSEVGLAAEGDPALRKSIEAEWFGHVALAASELRTAAARLRVPPAEESSQTRKLRIRDLALGMFGILSLAGAILWRLALSPSSLWGVGRGTPEEGDFSLVAYRLSRDAILVVDHDGNVRAMNAASEKMLGGSAVTYLGKPVARIVPVPGQDVLEPVAAEAKSEDGAAIPVEMMYRQLRDGSSNSSIVILREQPPASALQARAAMASAGDSTLLADLLMLCPAPLVMLDSSGHFIHFNRACFEATGYRIEEVQGRRYWEVALRGTAAEEERKRWEAGETFSNSRFSRQVWWTERDAVHFDWSWSVIGGGAGAPQLIIAIGVEVKRGRGSEQQILTLS